LVYDVNPHVTLLALQNLLMIWQVMPCQVLPIPLLVGRRVLVRHDPTWPGCSDHSQDLSNSTLAVRSPGEIFFLPLSSQINALDLLRGLLVYDPLQQSPLPQKPDATLGSRLPLCRVRPLNCRCLSTAVR